MLFDRKEEKVNKSNERQLAKELVHEPRAGAFRWKKHGLWIRGYMDTWSVERGVWNMGHGPWVVKYGLILWEHGECHCIS